MPSVDTQPQRFLDPAVLAQIQGLHLRANRIVEGYVAGLHRSPFHGFSVEFAEHREYTAGDDLRYLDWKVLGKSDKVYLKQYEEETNLICYLVLDISESMRYQSAQAPLSKLEYAQCASAALAHLVLHQQDSVGLATFDSDVQKVVRANSSPVHLKQLLHVMEETRAERKTQTGPIFHELAERFNRRGIVVVLSDLFDDVESMIAGLKHFRHRRHDVIILQVLDPAELEFPFSQATLFRGLEQAGELLVEPSRLRKAYRAEINSFVDRIRRECHIQGADHLLIRSNESLGKVLSTYLAHRQRRAR